MTLSWRSMLAFASDNKKVVAISFVISVVGLVWTMGIDIFELTRRDPVTQTEVNTGRAADAAEETATLLKESLSNPRQKLTMLGYGFTKEDFLRAVNTGDIDAISYFCTVPSVKLSGSVNFFLNQPSRPHSALKLLRNCPTFDADSECSWDEMSYDPNSYRFDEVDLVCGGSARRKFETDIEKAAAKLNQERIDACMTAKNEVFTQRDILIIDSSLSSSIMQPLTFSEGCAALGIHLLD